MNVLFFLGCRVIDEILYLVLNKEIFRFILRVVKLWVKRKYFKFFILCLYYKIIIFSC